MAAPDPLRMGLEIEYHWIRIRWQRASADPSVAPVLWLPDATTGRRNIPFTVEPLMVPANTVNFGNDQSNPQWRNLWGFTVSSDGLDTYETQVPGQPNPMVMERYGSCITELVTAAQPIDNFNYWITSQRCARWYGDALAFFATNLGRKLEDAGKMPPPKWEPLSDLVDKYNAFLESAPASTWSWSADANLKESFKFQLSTTLRAWANGTAAGAGGDHWQPFFAVGNCFTDLGGYDWCDVQVNYDVDLLQMDRALESWISLWGRIWVTEVAGYRGRVDPDIGSLPLYDGVDEGDWAGTGIAGPDVDEAARALMNFSRGTMKMGVSALYIYATQQYAALWRKGQFLVGGWLSELWTAGTLAAVSDDEKALVRSLVTYVLVAGSIDVRVRVRGSAKNSLPQLPKTSPASIAALLHSRPASNLGAVLNTLATSNALFSHIYDNLLSDLRTILGLLGPPGNIPDCLPTAIFASTYPRTVNYNLTSGPMPNRARWLQMWQSALQPPVLNDANNYGYSNDNVFCCPWSHDVRTSVPAKVCTGRAGQVSVKMAFESRYGFSIMNLGFNPKIRAFMFNRSYLNMLRVLCGDAVRDAASEPVKNEIAPDVPSIVQNTAEGFH